MKRTKVIVAILIVLLVIGWGIVASNDDTRNSDESNIINERIRFGIYLGDDSTQLHITDECMALHPAVPVSSILSYEYRIEGNLLYAPMNREELEFEILDNETLKLGNVIYSFEEIFEE